MSEGSQTQCVIQGLYPANECEGRFWLLLARVVLAEFAREKGKRKRRLLRGEET